MKGKAMATDPRTHKTMTVQKQNLIFSLSFNLPVQYIACIDALYRRGVPARLESDDPIVKRPIGNLPLTHEMALCLGLSLCRGNVYGRESVIGAIDELVDPHTVARRFHIEWFESRRPARVKATLTELRILFVNAPKVAWLIAEHEPDLKEMLRHGGRDELEGIFLPKLS